MSRAAVEQLLYVMDQAFEPPGYADALISNILTVPEDAWLWVPPGLSRNPRMIAGHIGACKQMYRDHAFVEGKMTWDQPTGLGVSLEEIQSTPHLGEREPPTGAVIEWLRETHQGLRESVVGLEDSDLLTLRAPPEGGQQETRWIIAVLANHDLYHAGEIDHIRALHQGNDRWAWEMENDQ
jgi:hypothetical protein